MVKLKDTPKVGSQDSRLRLVIYVYEQAYISAKVFTIERVSFQEIVYHLESIVRRVEMPYHLKELDELIIELDTRNLWLLLKK